MTFKSYLLSLLLFCVSLFSYTQNSLVKWKIENLKENKDSLRFNIQGEINENWYIYALDNSSEGPLSLSITAEDTKNEILPISLKEQITANEYFDDIFNINVRIYSKKIDIECNLVRPSKDRNINILINGQLCNSINGTCELVSDTILIESNNIIK